MSQQPSSKPEANQKLGCVILAIGAFLLMTLIGQCDSRNSHLTPEEQRASDIFQDRLGADPGDADRAARQLNQMLERDRRRGR